MASNTVAQFAAELKVPPQLLIEQLRAAGLDRKAEADALTEEDKARQRVSKAHGNSGAVLARFERGLPGQAVGNEVEIS